MLKEKIPFTGYINKHDIPHTLPSLLPSGRVKSVPLPFKREFLEEKFKKSVVPNTLLYQSKVT